MARAFRVDMRGLLAARYPDVGMYLAELIKYAIARNARNILIIPADVNKGRFQICDDGDQRTPDGRLPDDGLTAAFLASDTITHVTGDGVRWVGRISGTHNITMIEDAPVGTTITLRRRRGETLLDSSTVIELAQRYAEMSPAPVEVLLPDGSARMISRPAPWLTEPGSAIDHADLTEYGTWFIGATPLDTVVLKTPEGEPFGAAYILPTAPAPREAPRHRLYARGVLLDDAGAGLLPEWAFFARCALDVEKLPADPAEARELLGRLLRGWLLVSSVRQPQRLSAFVNTHHLALKVQAAHDLELARIITRWLPFETTSGRLSITDILGRTRHVRYAPTRDLFRQIAAIAGRNTLLLNAGHLNDVQLLEKLPELYEDVTVERVDASDVLAELDDPPLSERSAQLRLLDIADEALRRAGCTTVMKSFEPADMPVLYLENPARLCLNNRSPLIARLARLTDETVLSRTVQLLHAQARLLGHFPLRGVDADMLSRALFDLVELAALEEDLSGLDHG